MSKELQTVPFQGGIDTAHEVTNLSTPFSKIQNFRPRNTGLEQRKGHIVQHTSADSSLEGISGYQFSKGAQSAIELFRQSSDGKVLSASNNPPTVTTGAFGPQVLAAAGSGKVWPASWGNCGDVMVMSDGNRQHQVYPGINAPLLGFHIYKGSAAIPDIPTAGEDYTAEVNDGLSSTVAVLDNLNTLANFNTFYVITPLRCNKVNLTISSANANAAIISVKYRKNDGTWATVSGVSDGTTVLGKTLAQTGSITWTSPTDELPHFMYDKSGFIYQVAVSAQLSATVRVSSASYSGPFQDVINLWDGAVLDCVEAQVFTSSTGQYAVQDAASCPLGAFTGSDYIYLATPDNIIGLFAEAMTPNKISATVTGTDIAFVSNGTGNDDTITRTAADFLTKGLEAGMTFTITGSASNNKTLVAKAVTATTITVQTGQLTNENAGASITIARSDTIAIAEIAGWTGASFVALSNLSDGSSGFTKSGYLTFGLNSSVKRTAFNGSIFAYWWRIKISAGKTLSTGTLIAFQYLPFFDINKTHYPVGQANAVWKGRVAYSFPNSNLVYFSSKYKPMTLNGEDGRGKVEIGDSRPNPAYCMKKFYNELLAWSVERGEEGGSTTIIEGDNPKNFDKLVLSQTIGIVNAKSAIVLEYANIEDESKMLPVQQVAFFISRKGVFRVSGRVVIPISQKIQNYFDPTRPECIRAGYEDKHWLAWDSTYNILRVGLCSGTSATAANVFFILDPVTMSWATDSLGQNLSHVFEAEAASGNIPVLQLGCGQDGNVYILNTTDSDVNTAIDAQVTFEFNGKGKKLQMEQEIYRLKVQSAGNVARTLSTMSGNTTYSNSVTIPQTAKIAGDKFRATVFGEKYQGNHISLNLRHNAAGEPCYLLDSGIDIKVIENNTEGESQ